MAYTHGFMIMLWIAVLLAHSCRAASWSRTFSQASNVEYDVVMPPFSTTRDNEYLCAGFSMYDRPMRIVSIESLPDVSNVHHVLLFACKNGPSRNNEKVWPCHMQPACDSAGENIIYAWGQGASSVSFPEGVGLSVGSGTAIPTFVLQIHYLKPRPIVDATGLRLRMTPDRMPQSAGMISYASSFVIPPRKKSYIVSNDCCYSGFQTVYGFAASVHTHTLGREVGLEKASASGKDGKLSPLESVLKYNPQRPQSFHPIEPPLPFRPGDTLRQYCTYDSRNYTRAITSGQTTEHEMCNLYLLVYSEVPVIFWCIDREEWINVHAVGGLDAKGYLKSETEIWTSPKIISSINVDSGGKSVTFPLGQVSGISAAPTEVGRSAMVWVFHRGPRIWNISSFDRDTHKIADSDAIRVPTVLLLDRDTGSLVKSFGADMFSMPHMISPARNGGVWLVDTGLHQVFKMSADGELELVLGTRDQPGSSNTTFCKPTHAVEAADGAIFVADGYCNSRIVKFDATGRYNREFEIAEQRKGVAPLPHSLALEECRRRIYVADRDSSRILVLDMDTGDLIGMISRLLF